MSRRPAASGRRPRAVRPSPPPASRRPGWLWPVLCAASLVAAAGLLYAIGGGHFRAGRLRAGAEAAEKAGNWREAATLWSQLNALDIPAPDSVLRQAAALVRAGQPGKAVELAEQASALDPGWAPAWLLRLELLRVLDRPLDAQTAGRKALEAVSARDRRAVLRALTLALLADVPPATARRLLPSWDEADVRDDLAGAVALARRVAARPEATDPNRPARIARLEQWLPWAPTDPELRAALMAELAEAGDTHRGQELLDSWPEAARDARYHRLAGRWALEYSADPPAAVASLRKALQELPHDWATRYRLARALHACGRTDDARAEALVMARHREILDPPRLGPRLERLLGRLEADPRDTAPLAALCRDLGLDPLADAWTRAATAGAGTIAGPDPGLPGPLVPIAPPPPEMR